MFIVYIQLGFIIGVLFYEGYVPAVHVHSHWVGVIVIIQPLWVVIDFLRVFL